MSGAGQTVATKSHRRVHRRGMVAAAPGVAPTPQWPGPRGMMARRGDGVSAHRFTDDALGRTLDRLHEAGT